MELLQNTESVKIREAAVNQTVKAVLSSGFRLNNKLQQSARLEWQRLMDTILQLSLIHI